MSSSSPELIQVRLPALLIFFLGADEIVARGVIFQARAARRKTAHKKTDAEDDTREAADRGDERDEETATRFVPDRGCCSSFMESVRLTSRFRRRPPIVESQAGGL